MSLFVFDTTTIKVSVFVEVNFHYLRIVMTPVQHTKVIMPTDYHMPQGGYFSHIKQPLKWILTYSNSCKNSQDTPAFGFRVDPADRIKNMSTPITRTNFKQQLQRQQLEQQEQQFQAQKQSQPDLQQSQGIAVPRTSSPTTVPPDVPSSVLQVGTLLL